MILLACQRCRQALTKPLQALNGTADNFRAHARNGNLPFAMAIHDSLWKEGDPHGRKEDGYLTTWISLAGLSDGMMDTTDYRRLNGCCGLDGLDGPNQVCRNCGRYVGTKVTDCWTPHIFEPLAEHTKLEALQ